MAPPLVKGRALVRRRIGGVVFLVVIALLVQLAVSLYRKDFTDTVDVTLKADRAGNQLSVHADVKVHGVIVGEVRRVRSRGQGAVLLLALDRDKASLVPRDVTAQLLPKTLFGEKEVDLAAPDAGSGQPIRSGDTIEQDRTTTALETEQAFNDLLPLLRSLDPSALSEALHALSGALRGRGDRIGRNAVAQAAYLARLNPQLATLGQDMQGLADLGNNTADATPDLLRTLDNLSFSSRAVQREQGSLDAFLQRTSSFADSARSLVADNEGRFVALARDSIPSLALYARYSPVYPCFLNRIAFSEKEGERVFGGAQPGLHITVEAIRDQGTYTPGQEPKYRESRQFGCYGLGPKPVIPFPSFLNPQDGYNDSAPAEDPGKGPGGCCQANWLGAMTVTPGEGVGEGVVAQRSLPVGTTELGALLLAPLGGA